jgi:hypothetical protein
MGDGTQSLDRYCADNGGATSIANLGIVGGYNLHIGFIEHVLDALMKFGVQTRDELRAIGERIELGGHLEIVQGSLKNVHLKVIYHDFSHFHCDYF